MCGGGGRGAISRVTPHAAQGVGEEPMHDSVRNQEGEARRGKSECRGSLFL